MKKRILSLLLAVAIVIAIVPALSQPASAGGDESYQYGSSFVIKRDGSLWSWGWNVNGQLGDATTDDQYSPVMVMEDVTYVSVSNSHTMAIKTDGSLWAWGANNYGQLGNGTISDNTPNPTPEKIMDDVAFVSAGGSYTMAIKTDGSLWAWGNNNGGQLWADTTTKSSTPIWIMDDVASVSAGSNHIAVIKTDGSLWTWGWNDDGQLGDDSTTSSTDPIWIMDNVNFVSTDYCQTMVIKADGSLWAWGRNPYGFGDGETISSTDPVKIMDDVDFVSTKGYSTMVIKNDGSLWGWGWLFYGVLTSSVNHYIPTKVMDSVGSVKLFNYHIMAIKVDGNLWCLGANESGQLGDGTTNDSKTPINIMNDAMLVPDNMTPSTVITLGYTISALAGTGGSISPSGSVSVTEGNDQTFAISANSGYEILDVLVDGQSVGAVSSYTFLNIDDDHAISATFRQIDSTADIYTITASAGTGGRISPSGYVSVAEGDNQTFTITANNGYSISNVRVDGVSIGARSSYTFYGVIDNHAISATFTSDSSSSSSSSSGGSTKVTVYSPSGSSGSTIYSSSDSSVGSSGVQFSDTGSHWASYYIENVAEKGWIVGYPDGTFKPNGSITRAELIMIVYRLTGGASSADAYESGYGDVGSADWYAAAVGYCADRGYLDGVFDGDSFLPKQAITRGEVAAVLAKIRGYSGSGSAQSSFSDVNPDDTFAGSIEYLAGKELLNGYPDGTFRQDNSITRAEICTILFKGWIA